MLFAGDLIQRWTNDLWHSPLHRVVTASAMVPLDDDGRDHQVEGSAGAGAGTGNCPSVDTERPAADLDTGSSAGSLSRQAIVFFSGPLEDSMVICIDPALMTAAQQQQQPEQRAEVKYAPIRAGDFLFMKLNKTNSH